MASELPFQEFLNRFGIAPVDPLSESGVDEFQSRMNVAFPAELRSCYRMTNGGRAGNSLSSLELLTMEAALSQDWVRWFVDFPWGYFPFAQNNDSNPVSICCKSPIAGYVVLVNHDDQPRLMHRSLSGFFQAAVEYVKSNDYLDTHELPSDFDGPERTEEDLEAARKLIAFAGQGDLDEDARIQAHCFACNLFGDANVEEIGALLNNDPCLRQDVIRRLKRISSPEAREQLARIHGEFDAFVERCAGILNEAGLHAAVHDLHGNGKSIRVDPGPVWLNMDAFFPERDRADFGDLLTKRVRGFLGRR